VASEVLGQPDAPPRPGNAALTRVPARGAFDLQGHRGARGLWPENTLAGFRGALALGVMSIELDVVLTQDGVPVVFHDLALHPDIVRGGDGKWIKAQGAKIASLTASSLAGYDIGRVRPRSRLAARFPRQQPADGARIPTLAEAIALLRGTGVRLDVEIKPAADPSAMVSAVLDAVHSEAAGDVSFRSFDWHVLRLIRQRRPAARLAWLTPGLPRGKPAQVAAEIKRGGWPDWTPVWAPDHRVLLKLDVMQAHAAGLAVLPYTVNRPARMAQLIRWGVDGFCTDRPDLARAALEAGGIALPAPAGAVPAA
jgi:glycerophosphoryl diester phosphodiesterase